MFSSLAHADRLSHPHATVARLGGLRPDRHCEAGNRRPLADIFIHDVIDEQSNGCARVNETHVSRRITQFRLIKAFHSLPVEALTFRRRPPPPPFLDDPYVLSRESVALIRHKHQIRNDGSICHPQNAIVVWSRPPLGSPRPLCRYEMSQGVTWRLPDAFENLYRWHCILITSSPNYLGGAESP